MRSTLLLLFTLFWVAPLPAEFNYERVKGLLANPELKLRSIDALLPHLDPEMLKRYTLMFDSRSQQKATPEKPRVILRNGEGTFLLGFSGDPKSPEYRRLEIIEFDKEKSRFDFYSIDFPEDTANNFEFSGKNPQECRVCHGQDLRPNWGAYPVWIGSYGSIHVGQRIDGFPEEKYLNDFKLRSLTEPRFRHLVDLAKTTLNDQVANNLSFNRAVATLNFQRVGRLIRESKDFAKYRYAISAVFKCENLESFLPQSVKAKFLHDARYYLEDSERIDKAIKTERAKTYKNAQSTFYRPQFVGPLRFIFEGRGISIADWSPNFERDYNFSTGGFGIEELKTYLPQQESCAELSKLSLEALKDE